MGMRAVAEVTRPRQRGDLGEEVISGVRAFILDVELTGKGLLLQRAFVLGDAT